ncbi:MAG: RtcB family protein [Geobacteraceae bacterium]|nr:RtcB family protein [Geobacteraceae bacterium]
MFLPDSCPGKSPLPTGSAVFTSQPDWRMFALSDCGCGMRLLRSELKSADLTGELWDEVAIRVKQNSGGLGDLGGGNHFLDALLPYDEDMLYFLIHTGSRLESGLVDEFVDMPSRFDCEFKRVVDWAEVNRTKVQESVERVVGATKLVLDLPHNTFEAVTDGVIIRKGSVKIEPGDLAIIPSHMSGDALLVRATDRIREVLCSMSHGTGRTMSRGDAKVAAADFDFDKLRREILMPSFMSNASLTTEGPFAYRNLDDCLALITGYVEEVQRFSVLAYAGHL